MTDRFEQINDILQIKKAFEYDPVVVETYKHLIIFINDLYKHIEPEFHKGKIVVFKTLDSKFRPIDFGNENYFFDPFDLVNEKTSNIFMQLKDGEPDLLWKNINPDLTDLSSKAIVYEYHNEEEKFFAGGKEIKVVKRVNSSSNFATYFSDLREALNKYNLKQIRHSSCPIFNEVWFDSNRIFFKNAPESEMQLSLSAYLRNSLNFKGDIIEIEREHNTDTSNPVDLRVLWKQTNRSAIIELKWLGKSMNKKVKRTKSYSNSRAVQGMDQLKKYLDKDRQSNPTYSTKGFLVVIDGRRRCPDETITTISRMDGLHYQDKELEFKPSKEYHKTRKDFEKPIRMFAEPICQD